ncbi:glycosyltransferase [Pseudomonas fakonensis]|uniref:Glycosyltransferase n=1 Tax=Pseudomonas fakonensis TaxID=2842355 RepID=A0ABX8NAM9_9PSED|nr:glycosyltransferase [Pseudomonas fakonensis]QXH52900.1 glycosyltransferase [Pseudomonas fakonensis]
MLFLANVLELNGGTTFILRVAREYAAKGRRIGVLVMFDIVNGQLEAELLKYADVYRLRDHAAWGTRSLFRSQLGAFMPLNKTGLDELVCRHGGHVHVMGVFGVLLLRRMAGMGVALKGVSFGIYHQNEIMYQSVPAYFSDCAQSLFSALPAPSVVFFNEHTQRSHESFFGRDYGGASVLPIGVALPAWGGRSVGDSGSLRLVSIGQLHPFKAYNAHVISMLNELRESRPGLVYEIYGAGVNEAALRALTKHHKVEDFVHFKGVIGYEEIPAVLAGSFAFIGSGTSIIESSALGVPSIVGIESIKAPLTYGFLSEIEGYSYNEADGTQPLSAIKDKLLYLNDPSVWESEAQACRRKAESFSIEHTVEGLEQLATQSDALRSFRATEYRNGRALLSFLWWALKERLGGPTTFSMRREQGSVKRPARKW